MKTVISKEKVNVVISNTKYSNYDIAFIGFGLATQTLIYHLHKENRLQDKKIAIFEPNNFHDKSVSYWGEKPLIDEVPHNKWNNFKVIDKNELHLRLNKLKYFSFSQSNLRDFVLKLLKNYDVSFVNESVKNIGDTITTETSSYTSPIIFNSCLDFAASEISPVYQHFLGVEIETDRAVFNKETNILMDFDDNPKAITFAYLLPFSEKRALIEYVAYDTKPTREVNLNKYIEKYTQGCKHKVLRTEFGTTPLKITYKKNNRVINIGIAGGLYRSSTGYAFVQIAKDSQIIAKSRDLAKPNRYKVQYFYKMSDHLVISPLLRKKENPKTILTKMFESGESELLLKFLNEEDTLLEKAKVGFDLLKGGVFAESIK